MLLLVQQVRGTTVWYKRTLLVTWSVDATGELYFALSITGISEISRLVSELPTTELCDPGTERTAATQHPSSPQGKTTAGLSSRMGYYGARCPWQNWVNNDQSEPICNGLKLILLKCAHYAEGLTSKSIDRYLPDHYGCVDLNRLTRIDIIGTLSLCDYGARFILVITVRI